MRRLRDVAAERAARAFVGREAELAALLAVLDDDGAPVVHLHGEAGIGKSTLLDAFAERARSAGAVVVRVDCRAVEPTERGFLAELAAALGGAASSADEVADRLAGLGRRVVLALDTYEVLRLLDTWVRQVFVPVLPETVRLLLVGRLAPAAAWLTMPGWHGLVRSIALGPLPDGDAVELLLRTGMGAQEARRLNRFARGHPLALRLAAAARSERPDFEVGDLPPRQVVAELTRLYLADVDDRLTGAAIEAAAVVRRATLPLLGALLPETAPRDAYDRLRALPFVEETRDGLALHEALQEAVSAQLLAADPVRHRRLRRAAWRVLREELRTRGSAWRFTPDVLYLGNHIIREAFFPTGASLVTVEPATPEDGPAIEAIARRHDGAAAADGLLTCWRAAPQTFQVTRDPTGSVVGFYCLIDSQTADPTCLREDPISRAWWARLRTDPLGRGERALLLRRWLDAGTGEGLSPVQGACFLDSKRTYMALRPALRRCWCVFRDETTYGPIFRSLGFDAGEELRLDGQAYHLPVLDFGPDSVDGWLARCLTAELGGDEPGDRLLDRDGRGLNLDGQRVPLTKLEFALIAYLHERAGKVVDRAVLERDVWGCEYQGSSNVVDVAVRGLRRKLGAHAGAIETVRGAGYRFRPN